jgi:hypothetical protein
VSRGPLSRDGQLNRRDCVIHGFVTPHCPCQQDILGSLDNTFLLANAPSYVLANDERAFPEDGIAMFDWEHADVARHEGDDTIIVAGSFGFDISDAELLLDALPRFLLIPGQHPSAAVIRTTLQIITPTSWVRKSEPRSLRTGLSMSC